MPDFIPVDAPPLSPTSCVFCMASTDPGGFVDGGRDLPVYGIVYCCSTCALQIGARFGMVSSEEAGELEESLTKLEKLVVELRGQLDSAQDRVVLSGNDLAAYLSKFQPQSPAKAVAERAKAGEKIVAKRGPK